MDSELSDDEIRRIVDGMASRFDHRQISAVSGWQVSNSIDKSSVLAGELTGIKSGSILTHDETTGCVWAAWKPHQAGMKPNEVMVVESGTALSSDYRYVRLVYFSLPDGDEHVGEAHSILVFAWRGAARDFRLRLRGTSFPTWVNQSGQIAFWVLAYCNFQRFASKEGPFNRLFPAWYSWLVESVGHYIESDRVPIGQQVAHSGVRVAVESVMGWLSSLWALQPSETSLSLTEILGLSEDIELSLDVGGMATFYHLLVAPNPFAFRIGDVEFSLLGSLSQHLWVYLSAASAFKKCPINQNIANFLMMRDVGERKDRNSLFIKSEVQVNSQLRRYELALDPALEPVTESAHHLASAFVEEMIHQSAKANRVPYCGELWLDLPKYLGAVRQVMQVEYLRLWITPHGIWGSVVHDSENADFSLFYWSPKFDNLNLAFSTKTSWVFRVCAACIWRDATVVRERAFPDHAVSKNGIGKARRKDHRVFLPRTVRGVTWGTAIEHRHLDELIARSPHSVKEHYRRLDPGEKASTRACENAEAAGYAPPPPGYTFVMRHTVGLGFSEQPEVREVICTGLRAAAVALAPLVRQ